MSDLPRHEKVTDYKKDENGEVVIDSKSYYDDLSHWVQEREKEYPTTSGGVPNDVAKIVKETMVDNKDSLELTITIKRPTNNRPMRIVRRVLVFKKNYGR